LSNVARTAPMVARRGCKDRLSDNVGRQFLREQTTIFLGDDDEE
jgi:hypothetical protein